MRFFSWFAAALGLSAVLVVAPARAAMDITIVASSNSFVVGGLRIAEQAGLFAKHDLSAKLVIMDSGSAAMSALIAGSAQFAISGPSEAIAARTRKQDVVIAANLYRGLAGSLVLSKTAAAKLPVKPDAPLIERLKALDGLAVAVPSATSALLGPIRASAEQAGAKIRWVYMAQPAMMAALEAGSIAGFVGASPFWEAPVIRGSGVLWINGPSGELPQAFLPTSSSCIQMTAEVARARPAIITALRATLDDVASLIKSNPAEAERLLKLGYPSLDPAIVSLAFAKESAAWQHPRFTPADMRQEITLLKANITLPGIDALNPADLLLP